MKLLGFFIAASMIFLCADFSYAQEKIVFDVPEYDPNPNYTVRRRTMMTMEVDEKGDTIFVAQLPRAVVMSRPINDRQYSRLIHNLKVVYPIALYANTKLREVEKELEKIPNKRDQERFIKQVEKDLKEAYTPVLKKMTISQGKILIKLIDRETGSTSYELVKQLRGGFSAFFWQSLARLFGANLKESYDPMGDDLVLESLVVLLEAGLL